MAGTLCVEGTCSSPDGVGATLLAKIAGIAELSDFLILVELERGPFLRAIADSGAAGVTLFAPSNAALGTLGPDALAQLRDGDTVLTEVRPRDTPTCLARRHIHAQVSVRSVVLPPIVCARRCVAAACRSLLQQRLSSVARVP